MSSQPMYGVVTIDGAQYLERWQTIPFQQAMTVNNQLVSPRVSLPGVYDFRLKGITRDILINSTMQSNLAGPRFAVRFGNTDGDVRYSQGGLGSSTDLVLDTLICGSAQFPYPVIPPIFYGKNSAISLDLQDITGAATATPYTIIFAFHGSYLIPVSTGSSGSYA